MNCSTFRKKLYDYMEQNMTFDMREAMETHMKNCATCREIYEEEKALDDSFREAFNINTGNFTSSRAEIMKNIDKNRYTGSAINKLGYHLKKFRMNYLASAAILALAFFTAPYINNLRQAEMPESTQDIAGNQGMNKAELARESAPQMRSFAKDSGSTEEMAKSEPEDNQLRIAEASKENSIMSFSRYMPKFQITAVDPKTEIKFGTPWKASPAGKFGVSIDGKGTNAAEEGIAELLINDKSTNSKWTLSLIENDRQFTPKFVEWYDEENLIVIVGFSHGTVSPGGEIFKVNINTGSTELIYGVESDLEQVVSFKRANNELQLQVIIYKDDQMNEYTTEQRTIPLIVN